MLRPPCLRPARVTVVCLARRSPPSTAPTLWERLRAVFASGVLPLAAIHRVAAWGGLVGDEKVRSPRRASNQCPFRLGLPSAGSLCAPPCSQAPLWSSRRSPTASARRPTSRAVPPPPSPPPPAFPPAIAAARGRSRVAIGNLCRFTLALERPGAVGRWWRRPAAPAGSGRAWGSHRAVPSAWGASADPGGVRAGRSRCMCHVWKHRRFLEI